MYDYVDEGVIINVLAEKGIRAAEEYFPNTTQFPYAVVLVPEGDVEGSDNYEIVLMRQQFRVELFTKAKNDPLRRKFKRAMIEIGGENIRFIEESYGKGNCYLTACEFETLEQVDFSEDEEV